MVADSVNQASFCLPDVLGTTFSTIDQVYDTTGLARKCAIDVINLASVVGFELFAFLYVGADCTWFVAR